jgi:endonuclease/exonuclease/phosphatase (EEP) superfamily protein YafD
VAKLIVFAFTLMAASKLNVCQLPKESVPDRAQAKSARLALFLHNGLASASVAAIRPFAHEEEGRMATTLHDLTFEQLAAALELRQDSEAYRSARAEITIRQMRALVEAAEAQKSAAKAQEQAADASALSAKASLRNANYILAALIVGMVAVFVAMVSAAASAFSAYYAYLSIAHPQ